MNYYIANKCPVCGQGSVLVVKDKISKKLLLICDDCESQWVDPINFFRGEPTSDEKSNLDDVTDYEDIVSIGWNVYINKDR